MSIYKYKSKYKKYKYTTESTTKKLKPQDILLVFYYILIFAFSKIRKLIMSGVSAIGVPVLTAASKLRTLTASGFARIRGRIQSRTSTDAQSSPKQPEQKQLAAFSASALLSKARSGLSGLRKRESFSGLPLSLISKVRSALSGLNKRRVITGSSCIVAVLAISLVATLVIPDMIQNSKYISVSVGGKSVGYIPSESEDEESAKAAAKVITEQVIAQTNDLIAQKYPGIEVVVDEAAFNFTTETIEGETAAPVDYDALANTLIESGKVAASAYALNVDGQTFATVASQDDANAILDTIRNTYASSDAEKDPGTDEEPGADTWTGDFKESILVENVKTDFDALTTTAAAVDYLLTGGAREEVYTVKDGDTIWDIGIELNLSLEEIEAANPGYNLDKIHTGDEIKLTKIVPFINYESTGTVVVKESIEYKVKKEETDTLYVGETEVKQKGKPGKKEVTYQETRVNGSPVDSKKISSKTLKKPVTKILLVGTKEREVVAPAPPPSNDPTPSNTSASSSNETKKSTPKKVTTKEKAVDYDKVGGDGIVEDALKFLGIPYVYGGSTPKGFDCSGFTSYVYKLNGISIPRSARAQSSAGKYIPISQVKPGDIVCWDRPGTSHHVGIYIGNNKFIHSPYTGASISIQSFASRKPVFAVRF